MDRRDTHRICRFCGASDWGLVHYAVRSYAHGACLFRARGEPAIAALQSHKIGALPVLPMMDAGLSFARIGELLDAAKAREAAR